MLLFVFKRIASVINCVVNEIRRKGNKTLGKSIFLILKTEKFHPFY